MWYPTQTGHQQFPPWTLKICIAPLHLLPPGQRVPLPSSPPDLHPLPLNQPDPLCHQISTPPLHQGDLNQQGHGHLDPAARSHCQLPLKRALVQVSDVKELWMGYWSEKNTSPQNVTSSKHDLFYLQAKIKDAFTKILSKSLWPHKFDPQWISFYAQNQVSIIN